MTKIKRIIACLFMAALLCGAVTASLFSVSAAADVTVSMFEVGSKTFTTGDSTGAVAVETTEKYEGDQSVKLTVNVDAGAGAWKVTQYVMAMEGNDLPLGSPKPKYLSFWAKSTAAFKLLIKLQDPGWGSDYETAVIDIAAGTKFYNIDISAMTFAGIRGVNFRVDFANQTAAANGFMYVDSMVVTDTARALSLEDLLYEDFEGSVAVFETADSTGSVAVDTNEFYGGAQSNKLKVDVDSGDSAWKVTQYYFGNDKSFAGYSYLTFWIKSDADFKLRLRMTDWTNQLEKVIDIKAGTFKYSVPFSEFTGTALTVLSRLTFRIDFADQTAPASGFIYVDDIYFTSDDQSEDLSKPVTPADPDKFEDFTDFDPELWSTSHGTSNTGVVSKATGESGDGIKATYNVKSGGWCTFYKRDYQKSTDKDYLTFWGKADGKVTARVGVYCYNEQTRDYILYVGEVLLEAGAKTYSLKLSELVQDYPAMPKRPINLASINGLNLTVFGDGQPAGAALEGAVYFDSFRFTAADMTTVPAPGPGEGDDKKDDEKDPGKTDNTDKEKVPPTGVAFPLAGCVFTLISGGALVVHGRKRK